MYKKMKNNHPTEEKLKRSLDQPDSYTAKHICNCHECQLTVGLLQAAHIHNVKYQNSESLIQKLVSLPALTISKKGKPTIAKLVIDSWDILPIVAVRDKSCGVERRLQFKTSGYLIDLIIDRLGDELECSLRISRRGQPVSAFVININDKKILPCDKGFFNWTTKKLPLQLQLLSPEIRIETGSIKW